MKIRAVNFLSWKELNFILKPGVTLIQGFNFDDQTPEGSGKSSLLNAIAWGAYGRIPKDVNIDEVITEGETHSLVELEFSKYTIVRQRGPNDLYIKYPDKIYRGKDTRETQKEIEKLLGMSFDTFCHCVYFAQNFPNKFVTANQDAKGKILSEIQNLEQFEKARKLAADEIKQKKEILLVAQKDVEKFETLKTAEMTNEKSFKQLIEQFNSEKVYTIQKLFKQLESLQAEADSFVIDFDYKKQQKIQSLEQEIKTLKNLAAEKNKEIQSLEEEIEKNSNDDFEKLIEDTQNDFYLLDAQKNELKVKLSNQELISKAQNSKIKELEIAERQLKQSSEDIKTKELDIEGALSDIQEYNEIFAEAIRAHADPKTDKCPTCGQAWKGDPAHFEKEITKAKSTLAKGEKVLAGYKLELGNLMDKRKALKALISELKKEIDGFEDYDSDVISAELAEITSALKAVSDLSKKLTNDQKEINRKQNSLELIGEKLRSIENQIQNLSNEIEMISNLTCEKDMIRYKNRIENIANQIEEEDLKEPDMLQGKLAEVINKLKKVDSQLKQSMSQVENHQKDIAQLEVLREGYKEVKAYTFENVLNQLTYKANKYLTELFEQQVKLKFKNTDMKIDVIVTIDGQTRPLGLFSGGQFRRIALAVDLALSDIVSMRKGNEFGLLILDEYFRDLSEVSMERVLKILQTRKLPTLLIEHNSAFKSIITQTFEVELRDGISSKVG